MQIMNESSFKIKAYRRAAGSIYHWEEDIRHMYEQDRLYEIPGVGRSIKTMIEEIISEGTCQYHEDLLQEVPKGVLDMLKVPGLGHRAVQQIYRELGVTNLDELEAAASLHRIRNLSGMGIKTELNILKGIESLRKDQDRVTLGKARPEAFALLHEVQELNMVIQAAVVGSIRRGKSLIGDIDILVSTEDETMVKRKVRNFSAVAGIVKDEPGCIGGQLKSGIPFEIIVVAPSDYYHSLVWTTGSKQHRAKLFQGINREDLKDLSSEEEVYQALRSAYIPPELREDQGEIEAARKGTLPELVKREDIRGDLHLHTLWSDGSQDINAVAEKARQMGYEYIAITDHSKALAISNGLDKERLQAQGKLIDKINQENDDIRILKGIEVDILKDGSLDLDDEILKDLDLVIASIHSNFRLDREKQTERIISAMQNEHVSVFGHLSGRLLNRRPPYEFDLDKVLEAAAKYNVALEINAHPDRLDIDEAIANQARKMGIRIVINSDAHHPGEMDNMDYGLFTARRAGLEPSDLLNTMPVKEMLNFIKE